MAGQPAAAFGSERAFEFPDDPEPSLWADVADFVGPERKESWKVLSAFVSSGADRRVEVTPPLAALPSDSYSIRAIHFALVPLDAAGSFVSWFS